MKTYLIQRGKIKDRDYKKGIDSIVELDYMGYAEFEFGALPESLDIIRKNINEYTYLDVPIKDKCVSVFCKDSQKSEVKMYLQDLAEHKFVLKSYSDFNNYVNPSEFDLERQRKKPHETNFWWDLDNHLMFWKKNPEFEKKFKVIIPVKPA